MPKYQIPTKGEKLWTYTYPNNSKAQLDYIFINKKWIDITGTVKHTPFERVSSNHVALSAGAVVYTNCFSARPSSMSVLDMALNNLMVRF